MSTIVKTKVCLGLDCGVGDCEGVSVGAATLILGGGGGSMTARVSGAPAALC